VLHRHKGHNTINTVGDAIVSFLTKPDPTTKSMCLVENKIKTQYTWLSPKPPSDMWSWWPGCRKKNKVKPTVSDRTNFWDTQKLPNVGN